MRLVFVHGWSVTNTDTYGGLPQALVKNAPKKLQLEVDHLYLGKYVSFSDEVMVDDIARGMEYAVREEIVPKLAAGERFACLFSALSFALYHTAMMLGWFSPPLFLLALAGLAAGGVLFDLLDAGSGTIFPSWAVHIFANLAINTVGFILFKIL